MRRHTLRQRREGQAVLRLKTSVTRTTLIAPRLPSFEFCPGKLPKKHWGDCAAQTLIVILCARGAVSLRAQTESVWCMSKHCFYSSSDLLQSMSSAMLLKAGINLCNHFSVKWLSRPPMPSHFKWLEIICWIIGIGAAYTLTKTHEGYSPGGATRNMGFPALFLGGFSWFLVVKETGVGRKSRKFYAALKM